MPICYVWLAKGSFFQLLPKSTLLNPWPVTKLSLVLRGNGTGGYDCAFI